MDAAGGLSLRLRAENVGDLLTDVAGQMMGMAQAHHVDLRVRGQQRLRGGKGAPRRPAGEGAAAAEGREGRTYGALLCLQVPSALVTHATVSAADDDDTRSPARRRQLLFDRPHLAQIVANFTSNAIKFSAVGAAVTLAAKVVDRFPVALPPLKQQGQGGVQAPAALASDAPLAEPAETAATPQPVRAIPPAPAALLAVSVDAVTPSALPLSPAAAPLSNVDTATSRLLAAGLDSARSGAQSSRSAGPSAASASQPLLPTPLTRGGSSSRFEIKASRANGGGGLASGLRLVL